MIIYFSGTGNTKMAAQMIAESTGDRLMDLGAAYKADMFDIQVAQGEDLGIVFPVYRWSTPRIVDEFFRKANFVTSDGEAYKPGYAFAVDVYGYFPGAEVEYLEKLMRSRFGISFDATFEVPSVANCIYVSNPPRAERQKEQTIKEREAVEDVAQAISSHSKRREAKGNVIGRLLSKATGTEEKPRPTKQFRVDSTRCVSCSTCERICPTNTILIEEGHPVWQGGDCTECLACVHLCPAEAIDYGSISKGRRRYANPILKTSEKADEEIGL